MSRNDRRICPPIVPRSDGLCPRLTVRSSRPAALSGVGEGQDPGAPATPFWRPTRAGYGPRDDTSSTSLAAARAASSLTLTVQGWAACTGRVPAG